MKSASVNNYDCFGGSDICVAFNHCVCIIVGSRNILQMGDKAKCTFYDESEDISPCSLFENLVKKLRQKETMVHLCDMDKIW